MHFFYIIGDTIFVYQGKNSKQIERIKAINAANQIRDQDHGGRSKVEIIDEFSKSWDVDKFFAELGSGSAAQVAEEDEEDDESHEEKIERQVMLFKGLSCKVIFGFSSHCAFVYLFHYHGCHLICFKQVTC